MYPRRPDGDKQLDASEVKKKQATVRQQLRNNIVHSARTEGRQASGCTRG